MSAALATFRSNARDVRGALPNWVWAVLLIAFAVVYPYITDAIDLPIIGGHDDLLDASIQTLGYIIMALGLNIVVGMAGLLDLGYVAFYAIGAFVIGWLGSQHFPNVNDGKGIHFLVKSTSAISHQPIPGIHLNFFLVIFIAAAFTALWGVILGAPTLRLRGDYLAIVTLGFAEIIRISATSSETLRGDRGFADIPHPPGTGANGKPIFGVADATPYFWLGLSVIIVVIFAVRNLDRSRVGRSWLAIREDEEAAEIMGVRTIKYKLWAFAIGAFIGGLGGVMFAGEQGFMNSNSFVLQFSILVLAGVVMGGSGNVAGAILGGALISYIPDRLRGIQDPIFHTDLFGFRFAIFGLVIIAIMIFRPQGLIPSRRRAMELKDREKEVAPIE
jgi:branched-chain amino acid transport system permease protein